MEYKVIVKIHVIQLRLDRVDAPSFTVIVHIL